jgi:hypothetical protein
MSFENSCFECKEVDLEVNAKEIKYMFMSHHQNPGQNHNIKVVNISFENKIQILGITVTNQNYIRKEIKIRFNLGNACYHLAQNLLSFHLLSTKQRLKYIEIYF